MYVLKIYSSEKLAVKKIYKILLQDLAWRTTTNAGIYALASFDNFKDWLKDNCFFRKNKLVVSYDVLYATLRGY